MVNPVWIVIGIVSLVFISQIDPQSNAGEINNQQEPDPFCSIEVQQEVVRVNEIITGTITGDPNTSCDIFVQLGSFPFKNVATIQLNSEGEFIDSRFSPITGTFRIKARCGECETGDTLIQIVNDY